MRMVLACLAATLGLLGTGQLIGASTAAAAPVAPVSGSTIVVPLDWPWG